MPSASQAASSPAQTLALNRLKAKQALRTAALAKERNRPKSPPSNNGARKTSGGQPATKRDATDTVLKEAELEPLKRNERLVGHKDREAFTARAESKRGKGWLANSLLAWFESLVNAGNYFEYDLSKMVNSRGGFLMEDDEAGSVAEAIAKKRREERQKANATVEPGIDPIAGPRCPYCQTVEIEHKMKEVFDVLICTKCKKEHPDKYSLLTKTECREDYLLTDDELKDVSILPHLLRPNPHGGTFSNMMLFLRLQVEAYAFEKWGGEEGLDEEFERRETEKRLRREKKFQKGLRDLRSRTKNNPYQTRLDAEHVHAFTYDAEGGVKNCEECGFEVEVEVI